MKMTGNMECISDWLILNDQNEKLLLNEGDCEGILSACNRLRKGPWTSTEDAILTDYVKKHGEGNWNNIQKNTGLMRCGKSCRLRWVNHLRPNLKKGSFTKDEESLIVKLHAQMGNKWAKMAVQLPGRTDNEIKNFWNTRMKKLQRAGMPLYPPELCSLALQDRQLCDRIDETSSKDRKQHAVVQAEDNGIPEVTFDKYKALQCLTETTDVSYGDMVMKSPDLLHYSFPAPVSSCCKRMRESRQPFVAFKYSDVNEFSHAHQTQNCCKDSFSMSFMQQHNPHSKTSFDLFNYELPSVQSPEAHLGLQKKSGLLSPSLESVHDLPNTTPVQLESFKLKPDTKSENSGLLQSVIPQFIATTVTNPPPAMRTCSSEHTPDNGSGRSSALSSGVTDWEDHPLNQVSPLELDSSIFHECVSTPNTKSLPDNKPADKEISEPVKSEQVGQALYKDEKNGELADTFFNYYSSANSLFDFGWVCQEAISMHDDFPMANDPNTCILPVADSGEDDHMMVVNGSHVLGPYPSSWGIESSSYSWHNMPSIYHARELL